MADLPFFALIAQFAQLVVVCTNHLLIAHHNYSQFLSQSVFIWFQSKHSTEMNQGGSNPHWSCTFRCQQFQDDKTLYIAFGSSLEDYWHNWEDWAFCSWWKPSNALPPVSHRLRAAGEISPMSIQSLICLSRVLTRAQVFNYCQLWGWFTWILWGKGWQWLP